MKAIAAQGGVTQATVSMCLANNPRIPLATRERIQALARRLNYQPNPYLSTLMRIRRLGRPLKEQPVLALVCALQTAQGWREHPAATIRQMREGALERAALRGYRAEEFWLHRDGMSNERFSAMLHARGIQGLLVSPLPEGEPTPQLAWRHFAAVCLSVPLTALTLTTVCNDHYFSSLHVMRECRRRGYRRPVLILRRGHQERFQGRWEAGYLFGGRGPRGPKLAPPFYLEPDGTAPLVAWLKERRPDAIITPTIDTVAEALARLRWRAPDDVGLALLSCPQPGDSHAGIFQNGRMMGALAIDTLISQVERHERGLPEQGTTLMVEGRWNEGRTLRPPG